MKSKNIYTLIIFLSICSASFAQPVSTEGFSKTSGGLYYKLIVDNKKTKGRLGDVIKMNLIYMTQRDSVLFSTYEEEMGPVQFTINPPTFHGDPMGGFALLGEGDSALFLMPVDSAYQNQEMPAFAKNGEYIKIRVNVLSLMTKEDFENKKQTEMNVQNEKEFSAIDSYLVKKGLQAQKTASGLYYIIEKQGDGLKAEAGKTVTVNYTGKLMDGKVFDSSLNPGRTPFDFKLGAGQVIKGWDEGIALFKVGGKGTLIIPSTLGYGSRASQQIPANSPLIFDIELLSVK
ncbi:MAG: FKBP-type peptidyl-prolyl cis-trans isomerase [Chitinophagales bacterium]|nr:FKBP-type peptidyl-prolyl cis-trans isomerase [Chitinophagales bacterium]